MRAAPGHSQPFTNVVGGGVSKWLPLLYRLLDSFLCVLRSLRWCSELIQPIQARKTPKQNHHCLQSPSIHPRERRRSHTRTGPVTRRREMDRRRKAACWCAGTDTNPQKTKQNATSDITHTRAEARREQRRTQHKAGKGNSAEEPPSLFLFFPPPPPQTRTHIRVHVRREEGGGRKERERERVGGHSFYGAREHASIHADELSKKKIDDRVCMQSRCVHGDAHAFVSLSLSFCRCRPCL